jgi:transglutaminase TgpA-like protein/transglutaminase superfamily protein
MTATLEPEVQDAEAPVVEPGAPIAPGSAVDYAPVDEERGLDIRYCVAVAFTVIGTAVMVGGVFTGASGRIYAAVAGLLGIALAFAASRIKKAAQAYIVMAVGLFAIGLLMVLPSGLGNVAAAGRLASDAASAGNVLRPPVPLTPGWQAIIGWLMGVVGFGAGWVAVALKRAPLALLVPLPVAAIAGISVPKSDQTASGIIVLVLFAIGLGILSTANSGDVEGERPPIGYEIRRGLRAVPLLAIITVALYALAQADILFPRPIIDPTQQPQKPKTVPLSAVRDRVLFEVESAATGPWRIGSLDVYDGRDWRLPPFAQNRLKDVPKDGIVDNTLTPGVRATFTIAGLDGAVLPALPNTVGVVAKGPKLAYDARNGNLRVAQGQVQPGLQYTAVAAALPSEDDLRAIKRGLPATVDQFTKVPAAPPAVVDLIAQAPKGNKWDEFNFLRSYVLDNVTAVGQGTPVSIPPDRVQDMLAGTKQGSPFEIVAAQALLARWAGVPSRIGYGFDAGDAVGGRLQVRPRNGATFVEVYFPGYEWLPVIGVPKKAKPTVGQSSGQQREDPSIVASNDIAIQLFVPVLTAPKSVFTKQIQRTVLIAVPLVLLVVLLYIFVPALLKALRRARRRTAAERAGPRARIALAYAEWRDQATDFGYRFSSDTPLMFLDRFADDAEHTELAWLVTRALWGDLQDQLAPDLVHAAEELSRSLRRRLSQAHPATVRFIGVVSQLSRRDPYAPELNDDLKKEHASADLAVA